MLATAILLILMATAKSATWCDVFDRIMLDMREHKFSCNEKGGLDCVSAAAKFEIPGSSQCSVIVSIGLEDRVYYCRLSQPNEKLSLIWGQFVWNYFHFCASNNLLSEKGRIDQETSQPFISFLTADQTYTGSLEDGGTTFTITSKRTK
jgi:hypothetical protein